MLEERHNFLLFSRTAFGTFRYADWDKAYRSQGVFGVIFEFLRSTIGTNTWPFFIKRTPEWGRSQIYSLLSSYGIEMWGWGHHNGRYFFRVRKDKANWAEHILLSNCVPVTGRLLNENWIQSEDSAEHPKIAPEKSPVAPLEGINRFIDDLAKISI